MRNPFRRQPDPDDTLRLKVAGGDVAEILPTDWASARSLEKDKAELTRLVEALAASGAIDRATGGHVLDGIIHAAHAAEVADIKRTYLHRVLPTADGLVGAAEAHHDKTTEALGFAVERMQRHAAAAQRARAELIGHLAPAELAHAHWADQAAARNLPHDGTCLTPQDWTPPWAAHEPSQDNQQPQNNHHPEENKP